MLVIVLAWPVASGKLNDSKVVASIWRQGHKGPRAVGWLKGRWSPPRRSASMRRPIVGKEVTVSEKGGPMSRRAFTKLGAAAAGGLGVTVTLGDQQASVADTLKSEFVMLLRFEYPDRISG